MSMLAIYNLGPCLQFFSAKWYEYMTVYSFFKCIKNDSKKFASLLVGIPVADKLDGKLIVPS